MPKRNTFLQQLERRRQTHLVNAPSRVDKPSERTLEELGFELLKRAELEKTIVHRASGAKEEGSPKQ